MTKYCYVFVEGQQDVFFLGRILRELGLESVMEVEAIPERWSPFINSGRRAEHEAKRSSKQHGLMIHELFAGACFTSETHSIVLRKVDGNLSKFRRMLQGVDAILDGGFRSLDAVGLVPDANDEPDQVLQSSKDALKAVGLSAPDSNGGVQAGQPSTGIFALPGSNDTGGLEELLIDCGESVYPSLLTGARQFVGGVDLGSGEFTEADMEEMRTPQGPAKAIVGCVSSVLKPGSTIQVSVLRDRWVSPASLQAPRVKRLAEFLKELCGLS